MANGLRMPWVLPGYQPLAIRWTACGGDSTLKVGRRERGHYCKLKLRVLVDACASVYNYDQ